MMGRKSLDDFLGRIGGMIRYDQDLDVAGRIFQVQAITQLLVNALLFVVSCQDESDMWMNWSARDTACEQALEQQQYSRIADPRVGEQNQRQHGRTLIPIHGVLTPAVTLRPKTHASLRAAANATSSSLSGAHGAFFV